MNEEHHSEVEKVLLYIAEACTRASRARQVLERDGAEPHLTRALEAAEAELRLQHRRLLQATLYAVPDVDRLAV